MDAPAQGKGDSDSDDDPAPILPTNLNTRCARLLLAAALLLLAPPLPGIELRCCDAACAAAMLLPALRFRQSRNGVVWPPSLTSRNSRTPS